MTEITNQMAAATSQMIEGTSQAAVVTSQESATAQDLTITFLSIRSFFTHDLGGLVTDRGSDTVVERGRMAWLDDVLTSLGSDSLGASFDSVSRVESAYARTDRFGRSTLAQDPGSGGLPVRLKVSDRGSRYAGPLAWWVEDLEIGPSGAISMSIHTGLASGSVHSVSEIVSAYHVIRREAESVFDDLLTKFSNLWNSRPRLRQMFFLDPAVNESPCLVYDVLDFDYSVGGASIIPKVLYKSAEVPSLRALAGLTRMSSVYTSYDEASVRNLASLDIGSRSDELWIVNEARLVRHHPDRSRNPYVDAFFEDVGVGVRMLVERASSLIFLMSWLKRSQSELMHKLARATTTADSIRTMKELLGVLTEMGYLVSDPAHLEDTSGHSFFRTVLGRTSERLALDVRRSQIHDGYADLLALSQALSSQHVANGAEELQMTSLRIAKSSRVWAVLAVVFAVLALGVSALQTVLALTGE